MIDAHGSPVRRQHRLELKHAEQVSGGKVLFHNDDDDQPV